TECRRIPARVPARPAAAGWWPAATATTVYAWALPWPDAEYRFLPGTVIGDGQFNKLAGLAFFQRQLGSALGGAAIGADAGKKGGHLMFAFGEVGHKEFLYAAALQCFALAGRIQMAGHGAVVDNQAHAFQRKKGTAGLRNKHGELAVGGKQQSFFGGLQVFIQGDNPLFQLLNIT